ncbi:hypothetical protein FAF44_24560 [Nonomuraea sp. MG754425]|uniref:hypothetical protein n=1 Tax=Nonomuraea sp. MG754425 TaxID=2570319 RepID=UPI001F41166C|nr:hypothetical protein [Nonomuraea sp. MG754425]MCF6471540.1 hypothetical protein [Nonomuraea sp. MG754425]
MDEWHDLAAGRPSPVRSTSGGGKRDQVVLVREVIESSPAQAAAPSLKGSRAWSSVTPRWLTSTAVAAHRPARRPADMTSIATGPGPRRGSTA